MAFECVVVKHVLRRMRGGSQPFLVEGEDGQFYVAKFTGNPQGNRTLINEWIADRLFQQVGLSTPTLRFLQLSDSSKRAEALCFQIGNHTVPIQGMFHLGSQCPVNPTTTAIYDFVPRRLFPKVVNLDDLASAFVLDRWLGQTDTRQAVFARDRRNGKGLELRLYLIDHGMSFAGKQWELPDASKYGLYMDRSVYSSLNMKAASERALSRIDALTESDLYAAAQDIPSCWLCEEDYDALAKLLGLLDSRRNRLRAVVSRHLELLQRQLNAFAPAPIAISTPDVVDGQKLPNLALAPELC
jgi:nitroreductase